MEVVAVVVIEVADAVVAVEMKEFSSGSRLWMTLVLMSLKTFSNEHPQHRLKFAELS